MARTDTVSRITVTGTQRRGWAKADIKQVLVGSEKAILKDFADKSWVVRWLGRRQLRRETQALARLEGISGIPTLLGEASPCGLLLTRIEGDPITRWGRGRQAGIEAMFERLARLVDAIHARGVAHLDLRKRDNVLVAGDGSPGIIDFNASFCFVPGSLGARVLFPLMRRVDASALLKWKSQLIPHRLTPAERRRHRRMTLLRRFWIFN